MNRILKVAVAGLFGFMLFEVIRGFTSRTRGEGHDETDGPSHDSEFTRRARPEIGAMTGPGIGQRIETEDATTGTVVPHFVGRGVI